MNTRQDRCWILTTGEAGMRSQVIGLAEATGLAIVEKQIRLRPPWSWLPGHLCPFPLAGLDRAHDRLEPPWPDLLISCGRRSTAASIAVRRRSGGHTMTVHIQDPQAPPSAYDFVIPMRHDGLTGANVFPVDTALHRISSSVRNEAEKTWRQRLKPHNGDLLGIVLGGANRHYGFSADTIALLHNVIEDARRRETGVIVTPSRRTGQAVSEGLMRRFGSDPGFSLWDGSGENPYAGILAVSDRLIVTGESVSMISEALATGRPVHILPLAGSGRRHERFLDNLYQRQLADPINGSALNWEWAGGGATDATPLAAAEVKHRLRAKFGS
jgi:mitochondrial fission protein ELM1